jgi:hypothetical protein
MVACVVGFCPGPRPSPARLDLAQLGPARPGPVRPWRPCLPHAPPLSLFPHSIFPRSNSHSSTSLSSPLCPRLFGDGYRRILDPRGELSLSLRPSLSPSPFPLPSLHAPFSSPTLARASLRPPPRGGVAHRGPLERWHGLPQPPYAATRPRPSLPARVAA